MLMMSMTSSFSRKWL